MLLSKFFSSHSLWANFKNPIKLPLRSYAVRVTSVENRHTPSFDFDHYEISLSERTPPNAVVMSLKAVDEDSGRNGDVLYAVEGGATDQGWIH